uniref:Uncharacterized protein n=1 Tax=Arundo donax TaxID=35708 RepID=A0A0A9C8C6_ARUDO
MLSCCQEVIFWNIDLGGLLLCTVHLILPITRTAGSNE